MWLIYWLWWSLIWQIDVIDVWTLVVSDRPCWYIYISINVHFPTLCPKGTQKPYNLHSSPKCWPVISNINIYFNCHRLPTLLAAYIKYKCSLSNPVPEGHTETLLLTFIPQMLAWYIQYQHKFSTVTGSQYCWQHISNTNVYLCKCPRVRATLVWILLFSCHIYWCDIIPPWLGPNVRTACDIRATHRPEGP